MESVAEVWKEIEGWSGYEVSNLGRVRSLDRDITTKYGVTKRHKGLVLKQAKHPGGYRNVCLQDHGKIKIAFVHRLVLAAFVGKPPTDESQANHRDGDKTNNQVENLEWCEPIQNIRHAISSGLTQQDGEKSVLSVYTESQIRTAHTLICQGVPVLTAAKRMGISKGAMWDVVLGRSWKHLGLKDPEERKRKPRRSG